ncbi:MAG: hypothetical protein MUE44_03475 [Oscillatoriaceae cyanobacterium Prado104]|nr:hypothetical protein [Oscillatoriaceae cyanobacterium Prado104]
MTPIVVNFELISVWYDRQLKVENCALSELRINPDRPAMFFYYNLTGDRRTYNSF